MKRTLIILLTLLSYCCAIPQLKAQKNDYSIKKIDSSVTKCLKDFYKPNIDSLKKTCLDGVVMIKFTVDIKGRVVGIKFSKGTTKFITDALALAIVNLESDNLFISQLKGKNKVIIKPFWYDYQQGCDYPKQFEELNGSQFYKKHLLINAKKANYSTGLRYLLNFDDEINFGIECILLSPSNHAM